MGLILLSYQRAPAAWQHRTQSHRRAGRVHQRQTSPTTSAPQHCHPPHLRAKTMRTNHGRRLFNFAFVYKHRVWCVCVCVGVCVHLQHSEPDWVQTGSWFQTSPHQTGKKWTAAQNNKISIKKWLFLLLWLDESCLNAHLWLHVLHRCANLLRGLASRSCY